MVHSRGAGASSTIQLLVVSANRALPCLSKAQPRAQMHCGTKSPSTACTAQVHKLVIAENEAGAITRQEAVSMIPPLLLDVQPHHRVGPCCSRLIDMHAGKGRHFSIACAQYDMDNI